MWAFIVCRENCVEHFKFFDDYFEGEQYANEFIKKINPEITDMPRYRQNEFFRNDNLTVGLYKDKNYFTQMINQFKK